jgi:hypothetical protein
MRVIFSGYQDHQGCDGMRFRTLLIHRCSLLTQGQVIGEDEYGRDIYGTVEVANVPCRVDQSRVIAVSDEIGTDLIVEPVLIFDVDYGIAFGTEILEITDKEGNPVLQGSFSVMSILPIYDRSKLHHYEVTVRRK